MENLINKAVVLDYFAGRSSPLQKKALESWLATPSHRDQYYEWLHEWEVSHLQFNPDWQPAFERTAQRLVAGPVRAVTGPMASDPVHWLRPSRAWVAVASVVFALMLGAWLGRDQLLYQTMRTTYGEIRSLTLPDGSTVTLNANSSLRFRRFGFGRPFLLAPPSRQVELTGEADFSVRHLPTHTRFEVKTQKGLTVIVLGTEFTVLSRERNTRVALRSGQVHLHVVSPTRQAGLTLHPGDQATMAPNGRLAVTPIHHPEALLAWKHHRFAFDHTSLQAIADLLHDNYGLTVTIANPQVAKRTISGSFPARDAGEVVQVVADLLQLNYHRNGNHVTFTD